MSLDNNKLYGDDLHLTTITKKEFKKFPIDENIDFDWDIRDNNIILTPRQKVTFDDVWGMIDDDCEDGNVDELVYNLNV